jgi:hypothetical protein
MDYVIEQSSNTANPELVSPQGDESKIALLTVAVDHMLDRCAETQEEGEDEEAGIDEESEDEEYE